MYIIYQSTDSSGYQDGTIRKEYKTTRRDTYVNVIIYDLYVWNIWQTSCVWTESSMGIIEVTSDGDILPTDLSWNGSRWTDSSGISDSDHCRYCITVKQELLIRKLR